MIVKGASRSSVSYWSKHLLRTDHNEHVQVLELPRRGEDLSAAVYNTLRQFQDMTEVTEKGKKGLYCLHIDPEGKYAMSGQDWRTSLAIAERELGYTGQPRLVVKHVKDGREHVHAVYQRARYDERSGAWTLIPDSWNFKKHELAARQMETTLGHAPVKGVFTGRDRDPDTGLCRDERPVAEMNHKEWQQAVRLREDGKDAKALKAGLAQLWREHETGAGFKAALERAGYRLAQGDKKPIHMVVDAGGEAYELRRSLKGEGADKAAIVKRLADYPAQALETVASIREAIRQEALEREIAAPRQRREDLQAAFDKAAQAERAHRQMQATGLEEERDRYEEKIREVRRQGQELVEPRQPHAAAIAISADAVNDNQQHERSSSVPAADSGIAVSDDAGLTEEPEQARQSAALRSEQLQAWTELEQRQADRRGREERERGQRFRRGLLGYIDKLTGRHRQIVEANAIERAEADRRDREERERLETSQTRQTAQLHQHHARLQEQRRELEEERSLTPEREQDHTRGQTPDEHSRTLTPGGGRSRRRGGRASPFTPLRRRRERRFTGYGGKRTYRASPDRVTSRRGKRFMNAGKKKGGKSASAGTGRMWTANAFDMMRGRAAAPRPAPLPGGHAGRRPRGPVPGF